MCDQQTCDIQHLESGTEEMKGGKQEDAEVVNKTSSPPKWGKVKGLGSVQIMTNLNMRKSEEEDAGAVARNEEERAEREEDPGTSLQELD